MSPRIPPSLPRRFLIDDIGPWQKENLLVPFETFFLKNAYHPFATCGNIKCGSTGPVPMTRGIMGPSSGKTAQTRTMNHLYAASNCFQMDPTNFRSTRHLTNDKSFLGKVGMFNFQTIASEETIREPVNTFREFSAFIQRMPSHKAPGFSGIPADLFIQAPTIL